ncbi:preprotein translocase subunit YajC [Nonomuraea salmonea]|uniref:preprotein translocase subunit YajC n=1 Tax=Nonomuraea salmonea TaxID=46181 RepID=UPI0031EC7F02
MQNSLTPGTRVMTTTGLFATVVAVDNEDVVLEIAPGIETRWVKAAIGRVVTPPATLRRVTSRPLTRPSSARRARRSPRPPWSATATRTPARRSPD